MKINHFLKLFLVVTLLVSCSKDSKDFNSDPSLFKEYILNYSSGIVSAKSDIRIVLAFDNADWSPNKQLDADLFTINPKVDGKVIALSTNTVAFIPNEHLESDKEYQISFHLSEIKDVSKELKNFNFTIKTIKQDFIVTTLDLQSYSKDYMYLNGVLSTSDALELEKAKKLIQVSQDGKIIAVKFDKELSTDKEFKFVIDSIQRFVEDSKILINWNGKEEGIDQKGTLEFDIPGKNNFKKS